MNRTAAASTALAGLALTCGLAAARGQDDPSRALASELSADALARTQYMAKAGGFNITDGTNKLRVGGWTQFRYNMNFRDNPAVAPGHDSGFTNGFETTRTRLNFSGNVLDPNLKFKIEGEFSRATGDFGLLDAWGSYSFDDAPKGLTLVWGQFKAPLLREELVSDTSQLTAERSVTNSVFSQKRTQGVNMVYLTDAFRGQVSLNDGISTLNTSYTDPAENDLAVTARAEFKWGDGEWSRFDDFTSWRTQKFAGMVGAAINWQHDGNTASPGANPSDPVAQSDMIEYTADVSLEGEGWNCFGEFIGAHFDGDTSADNLDDFGVVFQAGVFVGDHDELFGRWDCVFPDSDRAGNDDFNTLTFGLNHYFIPESHALVATAELCWFLNEVDQNTLVNGKTKGTSGLLPDSEDNQFLILLQLQFIF